MPFAIMYPFCDKRGGWAQAPFAHLEANSKPYRPSCRAFVCAASGGEGRSEAQPLSPAQRLVRMALWGEPVDEGSVDLWGLGLVLPSPDARWNFPSVPESGAQATSDLVR